MIANRSSPVVDASIPSFNEDESLKKKDESEAEEDYYCAFAWEAFIAAKGSISSLAFISG